MKVLENFREHFEKSPELGERLLGIVETQLEKQCEMERAKHSLDARMAWAWFWFRVMTSLLGFAALVVFALVAFRFISAGAVAEASVSLGAGSVSVVAIFVTGR